MSVSDFLFLFATAAALCVSMWLVDHLVQPRG